MAENKKSFILYCDQKGVWDKLDDAQAGRLIKHVIAYVNDENPEAPDFITELAFEPIKASLKRDLKKWEKQQTQRSEAGKRSAEVRKRNAKLVQRDSTSVNERSVSSTVNGNVSLMSCSRPRQRRAGVMLAPSTRLYTCHYSIYFCMRPTMSADHHDNISSK